MSKPQKLGAALSGCHLRVCQIAMIMGLQSFDVQVLASGDFEMEPNDSTATAQLVGGGSFHVNGAMIGNGENGDRDVDIYRLTLSGPARIEAAIRAAKEGLTLDAVLWLRTCATGTLADFPDYCALGIRDDGPDGSLDPRVSVGVPQATSVYVMVSGAGNRRYDPTTAGSGVVGSVGSYDLEVTVTYFDGSGINEPNDSILTAAPNLEFSNLGSTLSVSGYVGDGPYSLIRGDRDFYSVGSAHPPGLGGFLSVEVTPGKDSPVDPVVVIYDYLGRRLATAYRDPSSPSAKTVVPLRCTNRFFLDGIPNEFSVFVMVMGSGQALPSDPFAPFGQSTTNPYGSQPPECLTAETGSVNVGAYTLSLRLAPGVCAPEPDDTLALATDTGIVNSGQFACTEGNLESRTCASPSTDVDLWRFQVEQVPAVLQVSSSACQNDDSGHVLRVFDAAGAELARISDLDPPANELIGNPVGFVELTLPIEVAGTYYVGISHYNNDEYDPDVACSGSAPGISEESYTILISLRSAARESSGSAGQAPLDSEVVRGETQSRIAALRLDDAGNRIDILDPASGEVRASLPAPEPPVAGAAGLAYDGTDLYYIGAGRYPTIRRMNPLTGEVTDEWHLWVGSGHYSGAAILAGQLYLFDPHEQSLHALDPLARTFLRTLPIQANTAGRINGGVAALAAPHRLYVADAFGTSNIYELTPSGNLTAVLDGFESRPTALGADGNTNRLYVGDWRSSSVEVIDRTGTVVGSFTLSDPVGAFSGQAHPGTVPDCNGNGADDGAEIGNGSAADCNANGVPDDCDVAEVNSPDCNENSIPDECESDCNENGIADDCETDCNDNGIPDSCEADCNGNGVADTCDIAAGTSVDTNTNSRPDECEAVLFVDQKAPPDGNGSTWAQALNDLQSASSVLAARGAAYGEIRVAQGVYKPAAPGGDRAAAFRLSGSDQWMGGYAGITAADPHLRDSALFPAILSGDLNGDDGPNSENNAENCFHVVTVSGTTEEAALDGFVITGGFANGDAWSDREGAGIFNDSGSATIRNCTVVGNHNSARSLQFMRGGGGISNRSGRPTLLDCAFRDNGPPSRSRIAIAGAMYNVDCRVTLLRCTFDGNSSGRGGALFNESSEVTISQCVFRSNEALSSGGAMINIDSHVMLADCLFVGNKSGNTGSGASILDLGGVAMIQGCSFFGNTGAGRAIATPEIALLPPHVPGRLEVVNSILWNGGDEILNSDGSMIAVSYSDLTGGWGGPGGNNLDVDPLFVDPLGSDGVAGTSDDNLRLLPLSPCIDAGDPDFVSGSGDTDLEGHPRVLCGRVDMGAYESGIGDYTCDRAVDLGDHAAWQECFTGPGGVLSDSTCRGFDFNADGGIDLQDFMGFQNTFETP